MMRIEVEETDDGGAADVRRGADPIGRHTAGAPGRASPEREDRLQVLYRRHGPDAVRLAYLLTGDRALAEDLAQEAFVRMAGRFRDLRDPDAFWPYLRKTVVNLSKMHFRRRAVERSWLARQPSRQRPDDPGPDLAARAALDAALLSLPERQRAAVVLRFYEDLSEARTAEILRCRPGTVKSLVSRGLASLRVAIDRA
jgi:RNA polymerase sigma-70 factor (sigma-E family)